jgi:hypothetical protein
MGLRYRTFKLEDEVSFVHISESEGPDNPLTQVAAFQKFQREIADRCDEQPVVTEVTEVGSYRFQSSVSPASRAACRRRSRCAGRPAGRRRSRSRCGGCGG